MALPPGTRLGPYEIVSQLGAGGMGEVYRAADTRLFRHVALKIIGPQWSGNREARLRFEREARAISALSHPHVCTLHDIGEQGEIGYLVMEFVEARPCAIVSIPDRRHSRSFYATRHRSLTPWRSRTRTASCIATSSPPT